MDDTSKDYMLDQAMASIVAFKKAIVLCNTKHADKSKKMTPTQKLKHLTVFINDEHDRMMEDYDKHMKNSSDEHSTT